MHLNNTTAPQTFRHLLHTTSLTVDLLIKILQCYQPNLSAHLRLAQSLRKVALGKDIVMIDRTFSEYRCVLPEQVKLIHTDLLISVFAILPESIALMLTGTKRCTRTSLLHSACSAFSALPHSSRTDSHYHLASYFFAGIIAQNSTSRNAFPMQEKISRCRAAGDFVSVLAIAVDPRRFTAPPAFPDGKALLR